jgi:hypothetical protein
MKRIGALFLLACPVLLFGVQVTDVQAQDQNCDYASQLYNPDNVLFITPISGATTTVAQTVMAPKVNEIKNVIVYGQDKEEEGISLTITINAATGVIRHSEWDERPECRESFFYQNGRDADLCEGTGVGWWYYEPTKYCNTNPEPVSVRRDITNVRVWLEPSKATLDWLRWTNKRTASGKATLQYLFPSRWVVGQWTSDGFTVTGTPDIFTSDEYKAEWLKQMKDFSFLAGDSLTVDKLWSVTLDEVPNPDPVRVSRTVLGIFGDFTLAKIPYDMPTAPRGSNFTVDYSKINGRMNKSGKKWAESIPNSPNLYLGQVDGGEPDVTIKLVHVPIDLPGIWYIGVSVEMRKADFDYIDPHGKYSRHVVEGVDWEAGSEVKWFTPTESGYETDQNYFYTYVLITTPCNPMEEKGCWDGSW